MEDGGHDEDKVEDGGRDEDKVEGSTKTHSTAGSLERFLLVY